MFSAAFTLHAAVASAGRVRDLSRHRTSVSGVEIATLLFVGMVAGLLSAFVKLNLRIPGHSVILAVFPMVFGLALVPRRLAGTLMGSSALCTAMVIRAGAFGGSIGSGAITSLCAIGVF